MMKNKKFDCVKMKNELQEKLFNELKPKSSKDYLKKLQKKFKHSTYLKELKEKNQNTVLI